MSPHLFILRRQVFWNVFPVSELFPVTHRMRRATKLILPCHLKLHSDTELKSISIVYGSFYINNLEMNIEISNLLNMPWFCLISKTKNVLFLNFWKRRLLSDSPLEFSINQKLRYFMYRTLTPIDIYYKNHAIVKRHHGVKYGFNLILKILQTAYKNHARNHV